MKTKRASALLGLVRRYLPATVQLDEQITDTDWRVARARARGRGSVDTRIDPSPTTTGANSKRGDPHVWCLSWVSALAGGRRVAVIPVIGNALGESRTSRARATTPPRP